MKFSEWKDTAELVGILAIVTSLVFVGLQMRQAQDIALSEGQLTHLLSQIEKNDAIINNPAIWVRGNAGEELSAEDSAVFRALVLNMNHSAFLFDRQARRMGLEPAADAVTADFAVYLHKNPGAWRVWNEREDSLQKYRNILVGRSVPGYSWTETVRSHVKTLRQQEK